MRINKADFEKKIDKNFIKRLADIYIDTEIDRRKIIDETYALISDNEYSPNHPEIVIDLDKGYGVARYIPILTPTDYAVYFFCILTIDEELAAKRVEGTYGGWSMGGAIRKKEKEEDELWADMPRPSPSQYTFDPSAYFKYWGEFNDKIKARLAVVPQDFYIVEYDIANFYDHIRLDLLENLVRCTTDAVHEPAVNLLFYFLNSWNKLINSYRQQAVSLPQELVGDCSRILANFYLQEYDQKMKEFCDKNGILYLRYADDHVLFVPNDFNYKKIIRKASIELSKIGLNINPKKIKVQRKIDKYGYHKCYPIFGLLDSTKKYASDQTKAIANAVAEKFLSLNRKTLVKNGESVLKTIISIGIEKLDARNRRRVLSLIYNDYISTITNKHLIKLHKVLSKSEKNTLYRKLNESLKTDLHNNHKYEVYKFAKVYKIRRFNWLKEAILDSSDWRE